MSVQLQSIITKQIPEFITADYPLFVEFFKAYYEYLQNERIDIVSARDVDLTLDSFITNFRKELDVLGDSYPYIDQRLFLRKSKQLFTAKGAEASYKLLFKILYNKDANITLPWDSVLKASAGKWQQETSLFIKLSSGDAYDLVGNIINVLGPDTRIKAFVQYVNTLEELYTISAGTFIPGQEYTIASISTTDFTKIGAESNTVGLKFTATGTGTGAGTATYSEYAYEVFINKDYKGVIRNGYSIEYVQKVKTFDAIRNVDINTNTITIPGHGFTTGDNVVYTYTGGLAVGGMGTLSSYYVIKVDHKTIKLAISYDKAVSGENIILSACGIGTTHTLTQSVRGNILPTVAGYKIVKPGSGFKIGDLLEGATVSNGDLIKQLLKVTRVDSNGGIVALETIRFGYGYTTDFFVLNPSGTTVQSTGSKFTLEQPQGTTQFSLDDDSIVEKYSDYGYIINPNYVDIPYTDISYAATLVNQFYTELYSQLGTSVDFALIQFKIGPVAKYPGHFTSNDGFLDDDIYIQDSYRWQKLSYVVSVDSRLEEYRSIVKAILHPAGTALFGEYRIENEYISNITHSQVLAQWISQATYSTINRSITGDYMYPVDVGGRLRLDAYDDGGYTWDTDIWNPPITATLNAALTSINATAIVSGVQYKILTAGSTNFVTSFGASANTVGTVFIANANGSAGSGTGTVANVDAAIVSGVKYTILTVGTTNFVTSFGASANTVGTVFTSNADATVGTGTGTVTQIKAEIFVPTY